MTEQIFISEGILKVEQEKSYVHVPFDMPPGAVRVEIEFEYSDRISSDPTLTGGNTIDLGLFDERGIGFLTAGFRGWTGSERLNFYISEHDATPGYLAGPLYPGKWNILLGLYKIVPHGCIYRAVIRVTTQPEHVAVDTNIRPQGGLPASIVIPAGPAWLRGEMHCHTWHSDGMLTPGQLVDLANSRDMQFLAVTDHNTIACQAVLAEISDPGLILIRGVEATTFKGHFNVWGIPDWVDFRVERPEQLEAALEYANGRGALTCCNHPKPYGPDWDFQSVASYACVEVWNGPWTGLNYISLYYWLDMLKAGLNKPAVGGSDFHRSGEMERDAERNIGTPTNWVYVNGQPDAASILAAVRAGHVSISDTPDGPLLELRAGPGFEVLQGSSIPSAPGDSVAVRLSCLRGEDCQLQLLDQDDVIQEWTLTRDQEQFELVVPVGGRIFMRAELKDRDGRMRALSNPIYFARPNQN
jgi:hypothetical protein